MVNVIGCFIHVFLSLRNIKFRKKLNALVFSSITIFFMELVSSLKLVCKKIIRKVYKKCVPNKHVYSEILSNKLTI